jgi:hypothetical protein
MSRTSRIEVTAVAKVTITRRWPDSDVLSVEVKAESCYPDALDQARKVALDTFASAMGVTLAQVEDES